MLLRATKRVYRSVRRVARRCQIVCYHVAIINLFRDSTLYMCSMDSILQIQILARRVLKIEGTRCDERVAKRLSRSVRRSVLR